jgi:hypothetical protein
MIAGARTGAMLLDDTVGDCGVGNCGVGEEGAPVEGFDPLALSRPWLERAGAPAGEVPPPVQDMLEDGLGEGTPIESYACFRGGA